MEYIEVYKTSNIEWKPSPVVALSTSIDESLVAAAREDGSLELWLVSPGSVGWHCQLTIQGNPDSRVSSLVWCRSGSKSMPLGRLLSSSIDGSISEWDFYTLKQKVLLESIGSSIWQMAVEPLVDSSEENGDPKFVTNGCTQYRVNAVDDDDDHSGESSDDDSIELQDYGGNTKSQRLAIGCDDGRVCIYAVSDIEGLTYFRSLPCVSGRTLSVAWSVDAKRIFSGSSDGFIRCWDVKSALEVYRITVGLGGLGSGRELCVWSLLTLRCGTLVSGDSNGSVQFWDTRHGTLLQAHCYHKADVNALATVPNHNRVFSAGSDGQVILYKLSSGTIESAEEYHHEQDIRKWTYVSYVRVHTHDIRALTLAVPIGREVSLPNEKIHKPRQSMKPVTFDYHKWAHLGIPMLISAGDDAKLFAYSARDFTTFTPHDICPAPQRLPVQLVNNSSINNLSVVLIQCPSSLDILPVHLTNEKKHKNSTRTAKIQLLARVKSKESRRIICSTVSGTGLIFAYSDHVKPSLFELREEIGNGGWTVKKRKLPRNLPFAHSMVFSCDSSHLILAGHDQKLYVVDMKTLELLCTYIPRRKEEDPNLPPSEPPITRMYTSFDGQWLAAINCFGDIYIFNLELERQHWFISRMNGASVTAAGFPPGDSNVLVITTSSNQVFVFDIEAKRLGVWSRKHTYVLPRRFQEFPGDVIGLSFSPSCSTSVIIYSARAMCFVDFSVPIDADDIDLLNDSSLLPPKMTLQELSKTAKMKRKRKDPDLSNKIKSKSNFIFKSFNNPVLFVGHLSESSLLVIEKPWIDVIRTFDAPVHRRIYGT